MNRIFISLIIILTGGCSAVDMKKQKADLEQKTIINSNPGGAGQEISLELYKGKEFYYPLLAAWIEDSEGKYIQTLYVPVSVATGIFKYGKKEKNQWVPAPKRAPQTLPFWAHKRGVKASDGLYMPEPGNPVPDVYSGESPTKSFIINSRADKALPNIFRVLFEINQNWDWNAFWTNNKYPDDENYKTSAQPALVYETVIDQRKPERSYLMKPIGHSHHSGKTGKLFTDLSTITTAFNIADSIVVRVK